MSEWRESANCRGTDPEAFFPTDDKEGFAQAREALAICERCPVVTECWWDQITSDEEPWGIRGGRKPSELRASMKAFEQGGDERPAAEVLWRAQQKVDAQRVREEEAALREERKAESDRAAYRAERAAYREARKEQARQIARRSYAEKRARELEEREAAEAAVLDDFPRQVDREQEVAEVA